MNVQELRRELQRRRVYDLGYVIDGLTTPDVVEGAVYVAQDADGWEVGVQERGRREAYDRFATEDDACAYALEVLSRDASRTSTSWWHR